MRKYLWSLVARVSWYPYIMREKFWQLMAKVICHPPIACWLIRRAMRTPYKHIGDYMFRYWLVDRALNLPFCIRIHNIKRADADYALHDHPADYRTFILFGQYAEEDVFGVTRYRVAGDTACGTAERFHRISEVSSGGVWSLFILGRDRNAWGFMVNKPGGEPRKVHWEDYVSPNDRGELHENAEASA